MWKHSASMACPSAALHASVFIRAHLGNPWFKIHRTTRFHSSLAFLKLISMPRSSPVPPKLGRFENYEILDWMVPRNAFFQKSAVGKFTFSLAGV
jgi:hypothetical protein